MSTIYVDINKLNNRISIDGEKDLIKVTNRHITEEMDLGDEDVIKMVTYLNNCDILIDKSIADKFNSAETIKSVRYGYYMPCYSIERETTQEREDLADGSIIFRIRKAP